MTNRNDDPVIVDDCYLAGPGKIALDRFHATMDSNIINDLHILSSTKDLKVPLMPLCAKNGSEFRICRCMKTGPFLDTRLSDAM